jgi:arylsulfatase B
MMLDDIGWHDTSVGGRSNLTENQTPALASLAESGVLLNRAYADFMCAPSRCSFLTGRLPVHVQQGQAFPETQNAGIPRNMTAIGNKLTGAGFRSHFVGKVRISGRRQMDSTF